MIKPLKNIVNAVVARFIGRSGTIVARHSAPMRPMNWATTLIDRSLDFVFPRTCAVCEGDLSSGAAEPEAICESCVDGFPRWQGLSCRVCGLPLPDGGARCWTCRRNRRAFRFCRSAGLYEGGLRKGLWGLKYAGRDVLARPLGRFLAAAWRERPELARVQGVVPVPLHFLRRHARGYNQSLLLAESFCRETGLPLWDGVLARRRWTRSQTRLGREDRHANVSEAFRVRRPEMVRGRIPLLIDDVCTTGATLESCGTVMRLAGAKWVAALTVARQV